MKKLFAMAAFAAAMCFSACTCNKTAEEALDFEKATPEAVVNALVEKVQAGDATAITAAIETVQTQLSKLLDAGNVEKVTEYATKIKAFVEENAEALKNFNIDVTPLTSVLDQVKALPGNAQEDAYNAMRDLLTKYDHIDGVYAPDDNYAFGIYQAIQEAGRLDEGILIWGTDITPGGIENIRNGVITGSTWADRYTALHQAFRYYIFI